MISLEREPVLENRGLEIIILAVVVLLLFGAKRLPDSARALGKSLRILKSEVGAMKADETGAEPAKPVEPTRTIPAAPRESTEAQPLRDIQGAGRP